VAQYVDGFVVPVPKKHIDAYRRMARKAGKIWREHGALEFRECVDDDLNVNDMSSFPKLAKLKRGETAMFSWIVFKSRQHRDRVNSAVMKDPRFAKLVAAPMPFDCKRTVYGGFKMIVDL
jgi:uncharacterized protein YbaA (DUF1428 family)